jgi:putative transposase
MEIMNLLDRQYQETPFYGVERLLALLIAMGYRINRKRLRRLLKKVCWHTLYPGKRTTCIEQGAYKYPYLLGGLKVERPNQVWAIDITYIPMERGFMYLFAVIDIYSRYVVGWSLSNTMTSEWCVECIQDAIALHGKPEIINSDQGSQFTSNVYIDAIKSYGGIQISMDGKGRAIDNVFIERLWRSVKYEHVYLHVHENGVELWKGLTGYFKFYNDERLHQSIDYMPPTVLYKSQLVA